jgi:hypothetical protein
VTKVVLAELPGGLLDGLPTEDQEAIREVVGTSVLLQEYDGAGRAELAFRDRNGVLHYIYVGPQFIKLLRLPDAENAKAVKIYLFGTSTYRALLRRVY